MAYNYEYPYFDAGNYNSDWLINKMKELEETVIGLETFKYIGENEILDLNQQKQNSIAAFTSNFNVLNAPVSNVQRITVTYGSETAYIQQLYDLSNFTVYARNYSTAIGWGAWKITQYESRNVIHAANIVQSGSLNTIKENIVTLVEGFNVSDCPTSNYGFLLVFGNSTTSDVIQLWYDRTTFFCYMRRSNNKGWEPWLELNHINLTPYFKYTGTTYNNDLNDISERLNKFEYSQNAINRPIESNGFVLTYGSSDIALQIYYPYNTGAIYIRMYTGTWSIWKNVIESFSLLRYINTQNANSVIDNTFFSGAYTNNAPETYMGIRSLSSGGDQYQLGTSFTNNLYIRFYNGSEWTSWVKYQRTSSTRSLTITSTAEEHRTDDEGNDRYMMGDNIYEETANTMYNTYISLPGQSLLHSDEGKQSFKDAILAADLSDTDVIMTNLEMWDMDIPLDTIAEEVAALSAAIIAKNPMCELTLLSIPPIDIPLWGDELLHYNMPNGSTLRQVDDRLFRLSEDHPFNYVSFENFYDAQNANIMKYRSKDFKTNKQYLRRVGTFIKKTM